jgi:putative membrane-bound dehydrogenase-like protein
MTTLGDIRIRRHGCLAVAAAVFSLLVTTTLSGAEVLSLRKGDHLCLVGNALGERLQFANEWETLLYQRFPEHELVVRNLCVPGDEPFHRDRSLNFGSPDDHLRHSKADVILFFFGFNESFQGKAGVAGFAADLTRLVNETKTKDYSGKGPPRMVLVSPIAHEDLGDPNIADGKAHNVELQRYTDAMRKVAETTGVGFADLYSPTKKLFEATEQNLTLNGVHLNDDGYKALAPILDGALFADAANNSFNGKPTANPGASNGAKNPRQDNAVAVGLPLNEKLKAEIDDKNFHWFHRYRAVNGYSIWGTRGEAGFDGTYRNRDVMERERAILDEMCANRDRRIWQIAQGKQVPGEVDDSNTLPFLSTKTNVGGDSDPNRKAGKLGSLNYIPASEQQKFFKLPPGYEINVFATEEEFPELANPVSMNFDSQGRLWVSTMPSYPQWQPKTPMDDKLLILEDRNGDGRADVCKVFAGGLHQPTGFELGHGGAFVAQQPDVLFLKDTDGDDRADVRIRRLIGFDTADSHHGLAAFEWGPDGALYFQEGTFKQSQVESPYGPSRLGDAGVWRYEPRTEKFGVHVSLAFANPWGHVFDRWGQNFIADASPGDNFWAAPISGHVEFPDKHPGASRAKHLDWGGSKSNRDCPTFFAKRIRPSSGCEFVSSRNFPPEAQGNYLLNNVIGDLAVLQYAMHDDGSGFGAKEITPLVMSSHGNFRPVDLQFGPDGALYIVDWHNALIGHLQHNLRDPSRDHSHGRIWRVTYMDRPLVTPPKIAGQPIDALLELLREPEDRTRYRVRRELAERETKQVVEALESWIASLTPNDPQYEHLLLEGLWVYQTHNVVNEDLLKRLLDTPDHRARAAATRVLSEWRDRIPDSFDLLSARIRDTHPRVRLEAVRACSFMKSPKAIELALDALNYDMDQFLDYTLYETIRTLESAVAPSAADVAHAGHDPAAHDHAGHEHSTASGPKPLLFLDKSPKIIDYQLARLSTSQLLSADRSPDDPKSQPLYAAILVRPGVSRQDREEALAVLNAMNGTQPIGELLAAIGTLDASKPNQQTVIQQLAAILLKQSGASLKQQNEELHRAVASDNAAVRSVAFAAVIASSRPEDVWSLANGSQRGRLDFLAGVMLVPSNAARVAQRPYVLTCLANSQPVAVRRAAIEALAVVPAQQAETFRLVAGFVNSPELRAAAVRTLGLIPKEFRSPAESQQIARTLVDYAESTPAAKRTSDEFLDAMQLADQLLALLPVVDARSLRTRLRAVAVRVVRINTVHEEMRYDTPYFAVEAGRPVQLVLRNEDLMPHNLVITVPGALREVAQLAATMSPTPDKKGLAFVPKSDSVLFATRMVESHSQDVLTFTAPSEPGEYSYVCTFPNHWMRMYGVMVVVKDLDAWLANPVKPADPLGITRELVQNWTVEDLQSELATALRGRTPEIGRQIFKEATCLQCHKIASEGGAVGPELTDVFKRWKGDSLGVLRELLDPSHKIEPKYAVYNILTDDGRVISGVVTNQDQDTITVVSNPENPQPQVIPRDDIDELIKTSTSLMPKGLLDRFTKDEIFELLSYLEAAGQSAVAPGGGEKKSP